MADFEKKYMEELKNPGVKQCYRHVDDIFAVVGSKEEVEKVFKFLNERHPNIEFTVEHENKNKLTFLDICIQRDKGKYVTTIYHKKRLQVFTLIEPA